MNDAFDDSTARWRRPAKRGDSTPLVVLLHGRGADENDLFSLASELPRRLCYVSPRGPVAVEGGGYTWFENRGPGRPVLTSLRASVAAFGAWLAAPRIAGGRRCFLLGFSAGMTMAGALLLGAPERFAGGVLLSGIVPTDGFADVERRLSGVPVFYAHGDADALIPAPFVQQTRMYLHARSGADLTVRTYPHGHGISDREIADIAGWLDERA